VTIVYSAQDNIEASIVKGLLEANGIAASINGHYLAGAIGELPTAGLISISVEERQVDNARTIISEYEQA